MALDAFHTCSHGQGALHVVHHILIHGMWIHHLSAWAATASCRAHARYVLYMWRDLLMLVRREILVAGLIHVLACSCPCLGLGMRLCLSVGLRLHLCLSLGLGDVHLVLHVCLDLLGVMERGLLERHVVLLLVHGLLLLSHSVVARRSMLGEIEIFVVVTLCIQLVATRLIDDSWRCSEGEAFSLDWTTLSWLIDR